MDTKYLSTKRSVLSSPGFEYNDLYFSTLNSTVSNIETTMMTCINRLSLGSSRFSSSSSVNLPNENFIGLTYLFLELPNTTTNQCLPRGWGYACLSSVDFTIGSSSSSFTIQGDSILPLVLSQCETAEQKNQIMKLGGQQRLAPNVPDPNFPGEDAPRNTAFVLLPVPWSSLCKGQLDYDTTMLSSNIIITVRFKDARSIYGGSDAVPDNFLKAFVCYREQVLSNRALSLSVAQQQQPELIYNYPFIFSQIATETLTGVKESSGYRRAKAEFKGFINSDVLGIYFILRESDDISRGDSFARNPNFYRKIYNPRLDINGKPLYDSEDVSWELVNMGHNSASSPVHCSYINPNTAVAAFSSFAVDSHILYIDFTRLRASCIPEHMNNTQRIANQTVTLLFNTPEDTKSYQIDAVYIYNGIVETKEKVSNVFFD